MLAETIIIGGGTSVFFPRISCAGGGATSSSSIRESPGRAASAGNAGWVTPSLSGPVPAPGLVAQSIRWMLRADSPLYIRPAGVPYMVSWLLTFWRHCGERYYRAGFEALADSTGRTMRDFDALAAAGLDFEMHSEGLLFVCQEERTIEGFLEEFYELAAYDFGEPVHYSREETLDLEPLSTHHRRIRVDAEGAARRPESLNAAVSDWLRNNGVEMRTGTEVTRLCIEGRAQSERWRRRRLVEGEQVLIATGAEAGALAGRRALLADAGGERVQHHRGKPVREGGPVRCIWKRVRVAVSPFREMPCASPARWSCRASTRVAIPGA